MKVLAAVAGIALFSVLCSAAHADPRLDEKVYDPYVEKGVAEFEARDAQEVSGPLGGEAATVLESEYGVSDRISLALVGVFVRQPGRAGGPTALGLEGVAYLGRLRGIGVDAALYLEYGRGLGGAPGGEEAKLLLAKTAGCFEGLVNLIAERPIGAPPGEGVASYGYAASATWRILGDLRLGAETFGDLGDDHTFLGRQGAYLGPQVKWEGRLASSPFKLGLDAGWLAAIGPTRGEGTSQVRVAFELEHGF